MIPGHKYNSNLSAWFADIRAGYELGPVLLEAMGMFTTGNAARDTTLRTVKYYQPLDTDTSYLADWGGQLTALGVDYLDAMLEQWHFPGSRIGWDKYGRIQLGARATYAWTSALSIYGGWNGHWTPQAIQKNAVSADPSPASSRSSPARRRTASRTTSATRSSPVSPGGSRPGSPWTARAATCGLARRSMPTRIRRKARATARNAYILTSRIRFSF